MRTQRMLRVGVLGLVVTGGAASAGCSNMSHAEKGALAGGAIGGGAGLVTGAALGAPRLGAAAGAALGSGIGLLAGGERDDRERHEREVIQAQATTSASAQAQGQRLGLSDVMDLALNGHSDQVIINKIRETGSTFPQLSVSDLNMLKNNKVSDAVIVEMQSRPVSPLATRVVVRDPQPTTIIYREPVYNPPVVFVGPRYAPHPRPYFYGGGGYYRHW